jgi:hypothetical protein
VDYSIGNFISHRHLACELFDRTSPKDEPLPIPDMSLSFYPNCGFVKGFWGSKANRRHTFMFNFFRGWLLF